MKEKNNITLSGFGWKAKIFPKYGMNTLNLTVNGQAILRVPDTLDLVATGAATYGQTLLVPPNRTSGAKFTFNGKTYCLPLNEPRYHNNLHGRLHRAAYQVLEHTSRSVTATYLNIGEVFPFPFRVTVCFFLDETGYHQTFTFENTGTEEMPLPFGLHTNFAAPNSLRVPLNKRWPTNDRLIPTGDPIDLSEQERGFCNGSACHGFPITGFFTSAGTVAQLDNILYTVSDNFNQWLLWNGEGNKGFISVEPLCGAVNCLNSGVGLLRLAPGQKEEFRAWFHLAE